MTPPSYDLIRVGDEIAAAGSLAELNAVLRREVRPFGITAHAAGQLAPGDAARGFFLLDWPPDWLQLYAASGFAQEDMVVAEALRQPDPFDWDELKARYPGCCPRIFAAMVPFGWQNGLVVPIHGPDDDHRGIVSLAGVVVDLAPDSRRFLIHVSLTAYERARRIGGTGPAIRGGLSGREREALGFVAQGLSDSEIASILGISKATAHFHVESAKRRLGAKTRAHAVALALARG